MMRQLLCLIIIINFCGCVEENGFPAEERPVFNNYDNNGFKFSALDILNTKYSNIQSTNFSAVEEVNYTEIDEKNATNLQSYFNFNNKIIEFPYVNCREEETYDSNLGKSVSYYSYYGFTIPWNSLEIYSGHFQALIVDINKPQSFLNASYWDIYTDRGVLLDQSQVYVLVSGEISSSIQKATVSGEFVRQNIFNELSNIAARSTPRYIGEGQLICESEIPN